MMILWILLEIVSSNFRYPPCPVQKQSLWVPPFTGGSCSVALKGPRDEPYPTIVVCTLQDSFRITLWDPLPERVLSANVNMISIDSKSPTRPCSGKKQYSMPFQLNKYGQVHFQGSSTFDPIPHTGRLHSACPVTSLWGTIIDEKSKNKPNLELRVHRLTGDCVLKDDDERITLNKERLLEIHNNKEQDTWSNLIRGSTMDEREAISIKECIG